MTVGVPDPISKQIDEIIDGLPRIKPPVVGSSFFLADEDDPTTEEYDDRPTYRWPWVMVGAALVSPFAVAFGMAIAKPPPPKPLPAITVTRTVEKPVDRKVYPESCTKAMRLIKNTLPDQAGIVSAGNPQLDILAEAYQALMLKDYKKLNDVAQRQRDLRAKISNHTDVVLQSRDEITRLIDQCNRDVK